MTGAVGLTKRQHETLCFIHEFIETHGHSPTYEEIMAELEYNNRSHVGWCVNRLMERGWIWKQYGVPRSIRVLRAPRMPNFDGVFEITDKGQEVLSNELPG